MLWHSKDQPKKSQDQRAEEGGGAVQQRHSEKVGHASFDLQWVHQTASLWECTMLYLYIWYEIFCTGHNFSWLSIMFPQFLFLLLFFTSKPEITFLWQYDVFVSVKSVLLCVFLKFMSPVIDFLSRESDWFYLQAVVCSNCEGKHCRAHCWLQSWWQQPSSDAVVPTQTEQPVDEPHWAHSRPGWAGVWEPVSRQILHKERIHSKRVSDHSKSESIRLSCVLLCCQRTVMWFNATASLKTPTAQKPLVLKVLGC